MNENLSDNYTAINSDNNATASAGNNIADSSNTASADNNIADSSNNTASAGKDRKSVV